MRKLVRRAASPGHCPERKAARPTRTYDYIYDLVGNRCAALESDGAYGGGGDIITDQICGDTLPTPDEHLTVTEFGFDALNQLTQMQVDGAIQAYYTYDPAGNLTDVGTLAGQSDLHAYTFDAAHRLVGHQDGTTSALSTYAYDGLGDRYRQTVNGQATDYILDRNASLTQVLGEVGMGDPTYFLPGIGQQTGTDWTYFGTDGLGSVRQMFDAAGAIDYAISFDPYGVPIEQYVGANNTNLGFTGEQTNANGLVYLRARHYDPTTGTFLSRDPVLGAIGGRSIRFNGYAYAGANPVNYVDPSGEFWWFLGLFLLGGGLDVGAQMLFEGKELGEVDMLRAGISGATAVIGGGAGFLSGRLIQRAGLTGMRALAVGATAAAVDFGAGVAADHYLLGDSMGTAVFSNVLGFGIGEALGYGVKGLGRAFRRGTGNAVEEIAENAQRGIAAPARGTRATTVRREVTDAGMSLRQRRTWFADPPPIDINGNTLFIGDGDHSFSASIARQHGIKQQRLITATGFSNGIPASSSDFVDYLDNIVELHQSGVRVRSGVNAMSLEGEFPGELFDTIIFNFPNTGHALKADQRLLEGFFQSADRVLAPNGRILVSHSTNPHYRRWGIARRAQPYFPNSSSVKFSFDEYTSFFDGYGHIRTRPSSNLPIIPGVRVWTFTR